MTDLLADLNPEQRAAVVYGEGPLLVLAGAGSGKTRVLTTRIAWLVEHGVDGRDLLAVTFTNKAAGEMRHRLERLLGDRAKGMWIGTFHSICARLLRQHASRVNLSRDFTIFDDDDQKRLVTAILKDLGVSERIPTRAVMSRIDRAKNAGKDPAAIPAHDYIDDVVRRVAPVYAERLAREDAVDFNDLLLKALDLCDDAEIGARLASRFDHVLVDEFQDTNRVQYRLVRHLAQARRNLCVVGDDDQAIYGWRGAEPRNLLDFDRDHPDARIVKLERNYRSTGVILAAANGIIAKNRDRHPKALWTDRQGGEAILYEECPDERSEGEFVARAIVGLLASEGRSPGDFAVLYRTHAQSRVIEEAMRTRRIAYRIVGGVSFFQRREVKDITEYLRLIANPMADSAFERVVNVPTRGIGDATVDRVRAHARACEISLLEAARSCVAGAAKDVGLGAAARRKLESFLELIDELRALLASGGSVATLVAQVIERSEYAARLEIEDKIDGPDRLRNLHELVAAAAAYDDDAGADATLSGFNERIALTAATDEKDGRGECVTLMTIHAAKGLEFPVVFLAGLEENVFPSLRGGDLDDEIEEERRLAYVACTRAKDRLVLTNARTRRTYEEVRRNEPSRFLADIPPECLAIRARVRPAPRPVLAPRPSPLLGGGRTASPGGGGARARSALVDDEHSQVSARDDDEPVYRIDDGDGDDDATFPRGALVRHRIFGVGEVQDGSGRGPDRKLSIRFPGHGMKTIVAKYVEKV